MPWWMHVVGILFCIACVVVGVVFRPFWHSEWGIPAFMLLCFVAIAVPAGYGGPGKPYSFPFGLACGCLMVTGLLISMHSHGYIGAAAIAGLGYLGTKTKFVRNRLAQTK